MFYKIKNVNMEPKQEVKAPEFLVFPTSLINDVLSYLGTKPYTESAPYITAIQKEARVLEQTKDEAPKKDAETK